MKREKIVSVGGATLWLLLSLLTAQTAWAFDGEGTSESPYLIKTADDWATFAQNINSGTDADKYYKLSNNWDNSANAVTATVGTSDHPFAGHFDGNGKTLTVALSSTATGTSQAEQGVAPFHYISGATIENLTVAGTIASASYHTAGIVGFAADASTNTIQNCTVTATLNISNNYAGGIIGHGNTATVTISNCTFAGTINGVGGNRANIGGIWGWSTTGNPILENCLENGTYTNISSMHPMGLQSNIGTITNCYYVNTQIGSPANVCTLSGYYQAFASAPENRIYKQLTSGLQTYYAACNISGVKSKYYATGSPINVVCTVTGVDGTVLTKDTDYEATFSPATVQEAGDYTLTITAKDGSGYTGSQTIAFTVTEYDEITSSSTSWQDGGVYKVTSNVTINDRITVNGNVTLILVDGFTLTAKKGIELSSTETTANSLTINGEGGSNTGTLICTGGYQQSGIGAYRYGVLTINGGTVNSTGNSGSAGIGGSKHNNWGRTITINGGIVNATGNDGGAGIGGGEGKSWGGGYGQCGNVIINGGQVTATGGGDNGPGIGSGYDTDLNMGDTLIISISGADDFVHAIGGSNSYGINVDDFKSITLDKDKELVALRVGVATTTNIKGVRDLHLIPSTDALKADLSCAAITGIESSYYFTNADITITPVLTSATGTTLTEGTDYTTVLTHDSETATIVNTPGSYTYTFTGMGSYTGTQSVSFTVYIPTPTNLKQTAFAAEGATMTWSQAAGNVTSWVLEYSTTDDFSSDVTTVNDITATSLELTGLAKETKYSARVKAVLGDYSSSWSSMVFFFTTENEWLGFGETETTTSFPIGYGTYYSVTEQIYTKSEIGSANTITSIEFCNTSANFSRDIDIYMVHTDKSKFNSGSDWIIPTESDKVFSGTVNFQGASAWTTITLGTPFSYNGSQNVAIIIDSNSKAGSTFYYFRRMAYSDYSCLDYNNTSNNPDPTVSVPEGYRNGYRSQIRLGFNNAVKLIDNAANAATIASVDGKERTVKLTGRTLYKDGKWNTICLPFDVTIAGSPLDGATARTVTAASITGKKLSLTFGDAVTTLTAGTPYIIKWASGSDLTETDLVFSNVTIDKTTHNFSSGSGDTRVRFMGTYDVMSFDATDYSTLLLGGANTLYYVGAGAGLGACRAYFKIGEDGGEARQITDFDLNFVDGESTGISAIDNGQSTTDSYYNLAGQRVANPSRGLYIVNGRKVVVK